jgi:RNA 3'-phosphate cyclase
MRILDGSTGEGGGQILRTALFLSTLLGEPFRLERIRANRPKPGLKAQHLGILRLLEDLSGAQVRGAALGAETVEFHPAAPRGGTYRFDVGTAGSLPLFLQTLLPVCLLATAPVRLELRGGTDVRGGPTMAWVEHVLVPRLRPFARTLELATLRFGFEPAGGGIVHLRVEPHADAGAPGALAARTAQQPTQVADGPWVAFEGLSVAHEKLGDRDVAVRQARAAQARFVDQGYPEPKIETRNVPADSLGSSITLWVEDRDGRRMGADALGHLRVAAEDVGLQAASWLLEDLASGARVDRHLADHLVPWVALGSPAFQVPLTTGHLETNVWTTQQFLGASSVRLDHGWVRGSR